MSAPIIGDFSCAALQQIKMKADQVFADDVRQADYVADVEPLMAIMSNQTAQFAALQDPKKDNSINIWWLDDCDTEDPVDCTSDCEVTGEPIGSSCQEYQITTCFEKTLSITEKQFRTSLITDYNEVVAVEMLKKLLILDNYWSKRAVSFLDISSGINAYPNLFTNSGNITYIPAPYWNPDLFAYLELVQKKNRLSTSVALSGTALWSHYWKMQNEVTNPDGAANKKKMSKIDPYFDTAPESMDEILGEKAVFLWNKNSVAFVPKNYYSATPVEVKTNNVYQKRFSIKSKNISGLSYDVIYTANCIAGDDGRGDIEHLWKITSYGEFFLNPLGCTPDRTGVLQLRCGTGS